MGMVLFSRLFGLLERKKKRTVIELSLITVKLAGWAKILRELYVAWGLGLLPLVSADKSLTGPVSS